ncbi:MAG: hypothetical protein FJY37_08550 [Betaproteobacteria bacterium]|nr:hypothetical protein [Betaproteobacteria bacterium]
MQKSPAICPIVVSLAVSVWLYAMSTNALAIPLGPPFYTARIWGISPGATTHPLADSSTSELLDFDSELNAVNGTLKLEKQIGVNDIGDGSPVPTSVVAGVEDDGDIFYVRADTPNNYRRAGTYIGSAAEVFIQKSFRKDVEDAKLTYTYSYGQTRAFVNPEFGPGCPLNDRFCLSTGLFSTVSLLDAADNPVWSRADNAMVNRGPTGGGSFFRVDRLGNWEQYPWAVENPSFDFSPGVIAAHSKLEQPLVATIDLSGIPVGDAFSVHFHLYGYAYDSGAHLGLYRGAFASAQDPLAGDTGLDPTGGKTGEASTGLDSPSSVATRRRPFLHRVRLACWWARMRCLHANAEGYVIEPSSRLRLRFKATTVAL